MFEVDPYDNRRNAHPTPLTALGRFSHEAVALDPANGVLYETEDEDDEGVLGLLYRFLPDQPLGGYGSLRAGGRLQAMRVPGLSDLSTIQDIGTRFGGVEWVDVPDPAAERTPTRMQDYGPRGVAHAQKLEGCWWGTQEKVVDFSSTGQAYALPELLRARHDLRHPGALAPSLTVGARFRSAWWRCGQRRTRFVWRVAGNGQARTFGPLCTSGNYQLTLDGQRGWPSRCSTSSCSEGKP